MTAPRGFFGRWAAALVVAASAAGFLVSLGFDLPYKPEFAIRSDGLGYHVWTYAILKGDLSFAWFEGDPEAHSLHQPDPAVRRFTCKYPPGVALVRLPVMAWLADPTRNGPPYSPAEYWTCQVLGAVVLVGVVVFGLLACRELGVSAWWAQFAVVALTFGTGLYHHGTFDAGFSHIYSALGAAYLVWQGAKASRNGGRVSAIGVAVVSALLVLLRSTNVILVAFWAAGLGVWSWRTGGRRTGLWASAVGAALGLGLTVALNAYMFGHVTLNSYPGEEFVWDRPMTLSVLISAEHGLLTYSPILALVLVVGLVAKPTRRAAAGFALLVLAYAVLYGYWWSWHLGDGFGHRGFVELTPFAVPIFAAALGHLAGKRPWAARVVALACAVAAGVTLALMGVYWSYMRPV